MWKRLTSCFTCGRRDNNRSGSPEKFTNVSSSAESDSPDFAKEESAKKQPGVGKKGYTSFGHKNEGVQELQKDDNEQNESLRHRLSAKSSSNDQDADDEAKATSTTQSNASKRLPNSSPEPQEDETTCEKNNLVEGLPVHESKENEQGTVVRAIPKTNNVEIFSDKPSEGKSISGPFESEQGKEELAQCVEQKFVQDRDAGSSNLIDNVQGGADINNAIDVLNELSNESNAVQKPIRREVVIETEAKVTVVISDENAVELKESNFSVEGQSEDLIKEQNIAGVQSSDDKDFEVVDNDLTNPLGVHVVSINSVEENASFEQNTKTVDNHICVEETNRSLPENVDFENDNQNAEPSVHQISDANDVDPIIDNVLEKFSDRLSKCILDTILQDTQLLCSQSEDEPDESRSKERVLKFSDILAQSIVKSVIDYAKVGQGHMSEHDENDQLNPNVSDVTNKADENSNQDVSFVSSPANEEDIFSADEANDDVCYKNVHDYAKRLSQQILNDVLNRHDQNREAARRSSTDVYATKLAETVISNAINGAKSRIIDSPSLPDSDMGMESVLDLFIAEIVGNAVESAISRIAKETSRDSEGQNGNQREPECQQDMRELSEDLERQGENHMDTEGHLGMHNRKVECPNEDISHMQNDPIIVNGPNGQPMQQNGKLQSKWLSEDDLDELYDDDDDELSDEEELDLGESSKFVKNSNDDKKTAISGNHLTTPSDEKQFWRRSLIEELDDDMDFEEIDSPRSSTPSSPAKTCNLEDFTVDGSVDGDNDDEVLEVPSSNLKIQAPIVKGTDSSRSRLRSVDTTPVLVLDNGSAFLKVGFSDQALPKEIVSSVVGTPLRYSQDISGMEYSARPGLVFGSDAIGKAGVLHIDYPLRTDLVEKWSDVEGLWNYVLGSLMSIQDNPDFPILISQPAQNPKKNTEKIAEIMFEHFHMPSIFIADQLTLSLFSMGYTSGLSFSSGFKSTQAGVVYEGHVLQHTVKQLDIAGYQLTENLKKLLMSLQGFGFRSSSQWQIVDDIKKKLGFFSLDFEAESKRYKTQAELQTTYELPDGQILEIGLERFGCAESLFRPMEVGLTQSPAHMLIIEAINSCEEELQELCYKAMGISGGTTLMNGFPARLEQELREHDRKFKNFTAPEHRGLSTWLGGSVVASLPTFREMVVTVDEYAESGARVVHSKCF